VAATISDGGESSAWRKIGESSAEEKWHERRNQARRGIENRAKYHGESWRKSAYQPGMAAKMKRSGSEIRDIEQALAKASGGRRQRYQRRQ